MVEEKTTPPGGGKMTIISKRRAIQLILLGLVTLASGVIIGAGAVTLIYKDRIFRPGPGMGRGHLELVGDMRAKYNITDEQAVKLNDIFKQQFESMQSFRRETEQEMDYHRKGLIAEVKEVLADEQFEKWLKKMNERDRKMRGSGKGRRSGEGSGRHENGGRGAESRPMRGEYDGLGDRRRRRQEPLPIGEPIDGTPPERP